jgi:hypothetical protein
VTELLLFLRIVRIPTTIKAIPRAKITKSARNIRAHTELTSPAKINRIAKKDSAIPVIVSLLIVAIE